MFLEASFEVWLELKKEAGVGKIMSVELETKTATCMKEQDKLSCLYLRVKNKKRGCRFIFQGWNCAQS